MLYAGLWMMDGYARGGNGGMMGRHMGGDFGGFGPASLVTFSLFSIMFFVALLWVVAIKGYALWTAAKRNEKWWFIALLVINTFGLFEIVYLIFFAKIWPKKDSVGKIEQKHNHNQHVSDEKSQHAADHSQTQA